MSNPHPAKVPVFFNIYIYFVALGITCKHAGSKIYVGSCRIFSCSMWRLFFFSSLFSSCAM